METTIWSRRPRGASKRRRKAAGSQQFWRWMFAINVTFDKVEHGVLFAAVTAQGIPDGYLDLWMMAMYQDQTGTMPGSEKFSTQRGVQQGDVLNPLLFNAVLERAIRKWKLKMRNEGLRLGQEARLTNLNGDDTQISGPQIPW